MTFDRTFITKISNDSPQGLKRDIRLIEENPLLSTKRLKVTVEDPVNATVRLDWIASEEDETLIWLRAVLEAVQKIDPSLKIGETQILRA